MVDTLPCPTCGTRNPAGSSLCELCRELLVKAPESVPNASGQISALQQLEMELQRAKLHRTDQSLVKRVYVGLGVVIGVLCLGMAGLGVRAMTRVGQGGSAGLAMITFSLGLLMMFVLHAYQKFHKE